ncbi:MAG: histidine kinase [Methylibium sp. NZG]|nr:MAG: histidine kinase [Methylibium sp. NZG]
MSWLLPRILTGIAVVALGALLGHWVGARIQAPFISELIGGAAGVATLAVLDTLRGYRLINWLRGSQEGQAPRDTGFWGEIGYRVEKSVRLRERETAGERIRLAQFLSAIEASPNGVILLDARDQIEWCNAMAAAHFGLDPKRDVRQPVTNLIRAPAFVAYLQDGEFSEPVRFTERRRDGTLSVLIRRYGDDMKIVLSQDVTVHERSEAMRRDFVANVSHEIRTPLTVLTGFIETMTSLPLSDAERRRVLELMMQQARRMGTLVSDLLTLAQLEGSPRPTAERWVAVGPLMASVEADARVLSGGKHRFSFDGAAGLQLAGAEPELLSAITNLVNNAVRYTPADGAIEVVWRLRGDGSAELSVTDSGPGIAREHLPRLTERFYRVDGSRSRDTGGTGLGLSIVKHVAQRHGGELDIQSELGKGSCFRLVLPAARTRRESLRTGLPQGAAQTQPEPH